MIFPVKSPEITIHYHCITTIFWNFQDRPDGHCPGEKIAEAMRLDQVLSQRCPQYVWQNQEQVLHISYISLQGLQYILGIIHIYIYNLGIYHINIPTLGVSHHIFGANVMFHCSLARPRGRSRPDRSHQTRSPLRKLCDLTHKRWFNPEKWMI